MLFAQGLGEYPCCQQVCSLICIWFHHGTLSVSLPQLPEVGSRVLHVLPRAKHCLGSCVRPHLAQGLFDSSSGLLRSCFLCCRRLVFVSLSKPLTLSPPLTSFICDAVLSDARHISLVFSSVSWDSLSLVVARGLYHHVYRK